MLNINKILQIGCATMLLNGCSGQQKTQNIDVSTGINSTVREVELIIHPQIQISLEQQKKDYYEEMLNFISENENAKKNKSILNSQIEMFSIDLLYSQKYSSLLKYLVSKYGEKLDYITFFKDEFGVLLNKHFLGKIEENIPYDKQKIKEKLLFDFDLSDIKIYNLEIIKQFSERGFGATILGNNVYIINANSLSKQDLELVILHELGHIYLEKEQGFIPDGGLFLNNKFVLNGSIHEFVADSFGIVLGKFYVKHLITGIYNTGDDTYNYSLDFFYKWLDSLLEKKGISLSKEFTKVKNKKMDFEQFISYIIGLISDEDCKEIQKMYKNKSLELIKVINSGKR